MAQEDPAGPAAPWAGWGEEVETGVGSPREDHGGPGETHPEGASSTAPATGSALTRAVETRTLPGERSATSARRPNQRGSSHPPSLLQAVTEAEVAPGGCEEGAAGASWTEGGPAGCSEAAAAETEGDSEAAAAWTEAATEEAAGEEEEEEALGDPQDPSWSRWEEEAEDGAEGRERWTRANTARIAETGPTNAAPPEPHLLPDLFFKPEKKNVLNL